MQLAKTSAALARLSDLKVPFISILTNPTMAGVMASYASLGDVILAEPEALIGFAGPRVIKETTQQDLPKGFQTSNSCSSMVSLIKLYTVIKCGIQSADCSLLLEQKHLNVFSALHARFKQRH